MTKTIFKPSSWLAKINFINHLVLFNNVLVVVLAEKQGGKTTFLNLLEQYLDASVESIKISLTAETTSESLLEELMGVLKQKLLIADPLSTLESLFDFLNARKKHVLLLIDNAEYLNESVIRMFLEQLQQQNSEGYVHFCIAANFSLLPCLNQLEPSFPNLVHSLEPGLFTEIETKTYLRNACGYAESHKKQRLPLFSRFYQLTHGNLSKINQQLAAGFFSEEATKKRGGAKAKQKLSFMLILGIVSLSSLILALGLNYDFIVNKSAAPKGPVLKIAKNNENTYLPSVIPSFAGLALESKLVSVTFPASSDLTQHLIVAHEIPREEVSPPVKKFNKKLSKKVVAVVNKQNLKKPVIKNKKLLAKKSKNNYTVQILASQNLQDIQKLIKKFHLSQAKTQIKTIKGKKWYILTLGEYSSKDKAQIAKKQLAKNFSLTPWIRYA